MYQTSPHHSQYQIRTEEEEGRNMKVQWEVICDCLTLEDEENEEELTRLALHSKTLPTLSSCNVMTYQEPILKKSN